MRKRFEVHEFTPTYQYENGRVSQGAPEFQVYDHKRFRVMTTRASKTAAQEVCDQFNDMLEREQQEARERYRKYLKSAPVDERLD